MADSAPRLADIPQHSDFNVPTLSTNQGSHASANGATANGSTANSITNAKNTVVNTAQSAWDTAANHPVTQNIVDTMNQAPVVDAVKNQSNQAANELGNLSAAKRVPETTTANNQELTHYHSWFYHLFSWQDPRATGIYYGVAVALIFAFRYLPALKWTLKALCLTLGTTAGIELVSKFGLKQGVVSAIRPRRYFTIPRETLETTLDDAEQLINFFVIEFQRILFAENILVSSVAFVVSFLGYWLIKIVPLWGLTLIGVSIAFLGPLIYKENKALIDQQINNASEIMNAQAAQIKNVTGETTARATSTIKSYAGDYSAKAQEMIGGARGRSTSPDLVKKADAPPAYNAKDFPAAPTQDFKVKPEAQYAS